MAQDINKDKMKKQGQSGGENAERREGTLGQQGGQQRSYPSGGGSNLGQQDRQAGMGGEPRGNRNVQGQQNFNKGQTSKVDEEEE